MIAGRGSPAVLIRMTDEMKTWLKHKAIDNRRSLNSEVTLRLERSRQDEESRDKHDKLTAPQHQGAKQ